MSDGSASPSSGFCIYIDTLCQGAVPVVSDREDKYVVFETELEAQKEVVDYHMTRLRQFLDGEREFEDAISVEEYVVPVTVYADGSFTDADGNVFGPRVK
jgi:ATP phosphoribosyltransferase regulatory subunit HisZ